MSNFAARFGSLRGQRFWILVIFVHYLVYEVVYCFYPSAYPRLGLLTAAWKTTAPLTLVATIAMRPASIRRYRRLTYSVACFVLFLLWTLVLSIWSTPSLFEWLKLLPRFAFYLAVAAFFIRVPRACMAVAALIVCWALLAVVQYVLTYATAAYGALSPYEWGGLRAGPYGLLGNLTSIMYPPNLPVPIVRLAGFWNEPSNASASMFASVFLARWLSLLTGERRWRWAAWGCAAGGVLCFSNAGYLAAGFAVFVGMLSPERRAAAHARKAVVAGIGLTVAVLALIGRLYVAQYFPDNDVVRAVSGLRTATSGDSDEVFSGRLSLATKTLDTVQTHPLGVGMVGVEMAAKGELSASAPVMWLLIAGPIGLSLLLARDLFVWRTIVARRRMRAVLIAGQAFAVVVAQQASYGSWMNPLFFITAATVFATDAWARRGLLDPLQPVRTQLPAVELAVRRT